MAIVKMKRLRLLGMQSDRDSLFRKLQSLGCVEISEPAIDLTDPEWAALTKPEGQSLAAAKEQNVLLNHALEILGKYAPSKKDKNAPKEKKFAPRPVLENSELFDSDVYAEGLSVAQSILDGEQALAALYAEQSRVSAQKAALKPWMALDVPLELEKTESTVLMFGTVPGWTDMTALEAALLESTELYRIFDAGVAEGLHFFLLMCHNTVERDCLEALRPFGFSRANLRGWTGTAVDNDRALDHRMAILEQEIEKAKAHMAEFAPQRDLLRRCVDRSVQDIACEESKGRLMDTDSAFYLQGWVPAEEESKLAEALGAYTCAWETEVPADEDYLQVPVKLKNNWLTRPLNMVTEMYSLPAYSNVDPNPLMAPFFIFFFGMMMADMAYGIIMIALSLFVRFRVKPKPGTMSQMFDLMGLCGVSTFIFGAVTGGFLGDFIPKIVGIINPNTTFTEMPALFSPVNDTVMILVASLGLGLVQIFTGMAISMVRKLKKGEIGSAIKDEIAWYVIFILGGAAALTGKVKPCLIAIVVVILGTQWIGGKGIVGKLTSIGGSLYNNITGYFSDILSYSRLMALMLSGAVVAQVFNTLGAIPGNIVIFVIISLFGNVLNFALNLLGCYVHALRLQCLEYFGRFYEDGGKPFRPLEIKTKYVDVTEHK